MPASVGVLGGTFNPVHYGHLYAAEAAADRLGLARVLFVPSGVAPHKDGSDIVAPKHRAAMVELAIASNPRFALSTVEIQRSGPSYSVDTVRTLMNAGEGEPVLILGTDAFAQIETWHNWSELVRLVGFAIVARPGYDTALAPALARRVGARLECVVEGLGPQVSGTELRARLRRSETTRYLVPDEVLRYIERNGLYKGETDAPAS